jgi:hypothetical protein
MTKCSYGTYLLIVLGAQPGIPRLPQQLPYAHAEALGGHLQLSQEAAIQPDTAIRSMINFFGTTPYIVQDVVQAPGHHSAAPQHAPGSTSTVVREGVLVGLEKSKTKPTHGSATPTAASSPLLPDQWIQELLNNSGNTGTVCLNRSGGDLYDC